MLVACLLASFLQSTFFAYALVTDADEGAYMLLGRLAITGKIGLFQDEMTGQRMPLPYYVIGLSQLLFGRSLVAARFTSAALGLACLVLVYLLGQRLGGEVAGVLALLFAATQSVIIGYFAGAYYHSLVSLELLVALYVLLAVTLPVGIFRLVGNVRRLEDEVIGMVMPPAGAGADAAGDEAFVFLHADTRLPYDAYTSLCAALRPKPTKKSTASTRPTIASGMPTQGSMKKTTIPITTSAIPIPIMERRYPALQRRNPS